MSQQNWTAGSVGFSTNIKVYSELGAAIFETYLPAGAQGTNASLPGNELQMELNIEYSACFPSVKMHSDRLKPDENP